MSAVNVNAQNVIIPDANFKAYLVGNTAINTNLDTEIQVSEANAFTGTITCAFLNISDLTGIEEFTALTILYCENNQLTSIDVSQNDVLQEFNCVANLLTSVDVSNNSALVALWCGGNLLTTLDVSQNIALSNLDCNFSLLTTLDVSQNSALDMLVCGNNQLTTLDVSQNSALALLDCNSNQLTALDLFTNTALTDLHCENNQLTCLNLKNGNNSNFFVFNSINNPNLTCIEVDDVTWSIANWTGSVDAQTSFSLDCNNLCSCLPTTSSISETSLDTYTSPSGTVYTTGGVYTDTIPNVAGCDSIITITLSMNYTGLNELNNTPKQLLKIVDLMGRETEYKPNTVLIYVYDDGSTEKVFKMEL